MLWDRRGGVGGSPNGRDGAGRVASVIGRRTWRYKTAVGEAFLAESNGALGAQSATGAGSVRRYLIWPPRVSCDLSLPSH